MPATAKAKSAMTATIAAALSAAVTLGAIAPAAANDWYFDNSQGYGEHEFDRPLYADRLPSSRAIHRDDIGRFYVRHGRKHYIQFWDAPKPAKKRHRDDKTAEAAIIAGIAGLAVGAIIAGSQRPQQQVVQPLPRPRLTPLPHNAFPAVPTGQPRVITYQNAFEPWSEEWADWCADRYRSFNIRTGTYTGYDGVKRFCEVK
jgi:hypothetical protein